MNLPAQSIPYPSANNGLPGRQATLAKRLSNGTVVAIPAAITHEVTAPVVIAPEATTPPPGDHVDHRQLSPSVCQLAMEYASARPGVWHVRHSKSNPFPTISSGAYSTGVFLASTTDQPMTVIGRTSTATVTTGVADPDASGSHVVTIPRWPTGVLPATGTDGHADIIDSVTGTIHSFWQLKQVNGLTY
jgi:hypothetical protein